MANYAKTTVGKEGRVELHEKLGLTGAEISVNELPAGVGVPFVHSHKENEEIYGILAGKGKAVIDGETVDLTAGDWLRIAPAQSVSSLRLMIPVSPISAFRSRKILWSISPQRMPSWDNLSHICANAQFSKV